MSWLLRDTHTQALGPFTITCVIFGVILLTSVNACHDNNNTLGSICHPQTSIRCSQEVKEKQPWVLSAERGNITQKQVGIALAIQSLSLVSQGLGGVAEKVSSLGEVRTVVAFKPPPNI